MFVRWNKLVNYSSVFSPRFYSALHRVGVSSTAVTLDGKTTSAVSTAEPVCKRQRLSFTNGVLSSLLSDGRPFLVDCDIELVDNARWEVSSCLPHAHKRLDGEEASSGTEALDEAAGDAGSFDDLDMMRIRNELFYKLDRNSIEFEECSLDFHRKKLKDRTSDRRSRGKDKKVVKKKQERAILSPPPGLQISDINTRPGIRPGKRVRSPTFKQLTDAFHEPFCLDVYISKASIRACIVHRVTSKVVAVAHSISKDMKRGLGSTKNETACAAVGSVLAQRALADDIHDVVYVPRKGEKLKTKLGVLLKSIVDGGLSVKVRIKERNARKPYELPSLTK